MDSDDYFLKNKVRKIVNEFEKNRDINFIQDNPIYFYPKRKLNLKKKIKKINILPYIHGLISIQQAQWYLEKIF